MGACGACDSRALPEETDKERALRFRKLFRKVMGDRRLEHCEVRELLGWLNTEQGKRAGVDVYREWGEDETWTWLAEWAAEDDPNGVMVDRTLGEIFLLG